MPTRQPRVLGAQREMPTPSAGSVSENSAFRVGDDVTILLEEVLNNSIRAVLVYDDFSGAFTDVDLYSLSRVFRYNRSVISLCISGVDISDDAVSLLCEALMNSNVQYIDFTNTPLDDEAGSSLAALANCNKALRTVVVDDTLISEDIMDEIDLACQYNDSFPLPKPIPIDDNRTRYCLENLFGACPYGDMCLFSHAPVGSDSQAGTPAEPAKELPPKPPQGASWKSGSDRKTYSIRPKAPSSSCKKKGSQFFGFTTMQVSTVAVGALCGVALLYSYYRRQKQ